MNWPQVIFLSVAVIVAAALVADRLENIRNTITNLIESIEEREGDALDEDLKE